MELKNRIVFPPIESYMATADGYVTDQMLEYLVERARGGAGLIIPELAYVQRDGQTGYAREIAIYDDRFIPGLRRLVDAIHAAGAKTACQIAHAGRQTKAAVIG